MAHRVKCPTCGRNTIDASFCQYCGRPIWSCAACTASILREAVFCQQCGAVVTGSGRELISKERTSWVWWLLPLICPPLLTLPWVGGVISWALVRHKNPRKALNILWLGISMTIIILAVAVALVFN